MPVEIERKFLVKDDRWRGLAPGVRYVQGYLGTHPERTVRVRIVGETAALTIKGKNSGGVAPEFEYPVPLEDASHMLEHMAERPLIEKNRHTIPFRGFLWEVDEFLAENAGLILAEVELQSLGQTYEKPDWIGAEVTGDRRYYNASLVTAPYTKW